MKDKTAIEKFSEDINSYLPGISVDCVIIGYKNGALSVLVLRWKDSDNWCLPGGFVKKNENVNKAAFRVLKDRTGLDISFLKQLYVFGDSSRRNVDNLLKELDKAKGSSEVKNWLKQRFISVAYLALVDPESFIPAPDFLSDLCEWRPISNKPNLIFDHNQMIDKAIDYIGVQLKYLPIGLTLLPEQFTMKTLQQLYETVSGKALDRANFQKKMIKMGFLIRHEKQMSGGAHKAPYLYSFDKKKYQDFLKSGIGFL